MGKSAVISILYFGHQCAQVRLSYQRVRITTETRTHHVWKCVRINYDNKKDNNDKDICYKQEQTPEK